MELFIQQVSERLSILSFMIDIFSEALNLLRKLFNLQFERFVFLENNIGGIWS